jgi:hypothetical protein
MRELNARTDIGGSRWSVRGLLDLLTVHTTRLLHYLARKQIKRATQPGSADVAYDRRSPAEAPRDPRC